MDNNNTSGQGDNAVIPDEIKGWNWGAFLLNWIWGIGNDTYRAFWVWFPFFGFIMAFILGAKGSEWAWRHKQWNSVEHFKKTQKRWAQGALLFYAAMILLMVAVVFVALSLIKKSYAYEASFNEVSQSQEVISLIGTPIDSGTLQGSIKSQNGRGSANITYNITGPEGEASVAVEASKRQGEWTITCLVVDYESLEKQTVLVPCD